jgi:glycosyltransferase involved in cell wall biosynthesis
MRPRKLLVVSDEMEVGGSQRQITYLLGGLDRRQWQAELVFFRKESFLVRDLRAQGIVVHHVPKRGRLDLRFVLAYAALLRRERYDLVHAFSLTAELWTLVAGWLARHRPPLVASIRGLYLDESERFWRIKRFILSRSAAVIANARAGAVAAAKRAGVPVASIDVVPNGMVPPEPLPPGQRDILRQAIGAPPQRPFALFVGRLVKEKNLACLMRALARIPADQRPWVALAGNGPLRGDIDAMREAAGLDADVRFLGERKDTAALMQSADFLVLPSSYEGMSNVLMEAMAAGCPVIASEVGGNPELVEDGVTGLLFPSDDADALAQCLQTMGSDHALRQRLSQQAAQVARQRYSVEQLVRSTTRVYERCLDARTAHAGNLPLSTLGSTRDDA